MATTQDYAALGPSLAKLTVSDQKLNDYIEKMIGNGASSHPVPTSFLGLSRSTLAKADLENLTEFLPLVVEGLFTQDLHILVSEIVPLVISDNTRFLQNTYTYESTLPEQVPAFGVAHQMRVNKRTIRTISQRYGLEFELDREFTLDQNGKEEMLKRAIHMSNSFKRLAEFLVVERLLTVPIQPYYSAIGPGLDRVQYEAMICRMRDNFGAIHKYADGEMQIANFIKQRIYTRTQQNPNYVLFPSNKSSIFLSKQNLTSYDKAGPDGPRRYVNEDGTQLGTVGIRRLHGMLPVEIPTLTENKYRYSQMNTVKTIGEYVLIDDVTGWTISPDKGLRLYSQDSRNFELVRFVDMVNNLPYAHYLDLTNVDTQHRSFKGLFDKFRVIMGKDTVLDDVNFMARMAALPRIQDPNRRARFDSYGDPAQIDLLFGPPPAVPVAGVLYATAAAPAGDARYIVAIIGKLDINSGNYNEVFDVSSGKDSKAYYKFKDFFDEYSVALPRVAHRVVTSPLIGVVGGRENGMAIASPIDYLIGTNVQTSAITNSFRGWQAVHLIREETVEIVPDVCIEGYAGGCNTRIVDVKSAMEYKAQKFNMESSSYNSLYVIAFRGKSTFRPAVCMYTAGQLPGTAGRVEYQFDGAKEWAEWYGFSHITNSQNYGYDLDQVYIARECFPGDYEYPTANGYTRVYGNTHFGPNGCTPMAAAVRSTGESVYA